jgi:CubicO group peptidase (beta-lactamase class C family)
VFSGVALVARHGAPVFSKAYGLADRERQVANTTGTRFNIGSINKAFTPIAVDQIVGQGMLSRADTLGAFFPSYPQAMSRAATVEQLLTHRGGLADGFGPQFDAASKHDFAADADYFTFIARLPPVFAPGAREQYCRGCYIAPGAIVEKVAGMKYERYGAEKVFVRAGMASTGFPRSDQPAPDIAVGYTRRGPRTSGAAGAPLLVSNVAMHGVAGSAAGGGYSTALDLPAFVNAAKAGAFPGASGDMGIAGKRGREAGGHAGLAATTWRDSSPCSGSSPAGRACSATASTSIAATPRSASPLAGLAGAFSPPTQSRPAVQSLRRRTDAEDALGHHGRYRRRLRGCLRYR